MRLQAQGDIRAVLTDMSPGELRREAQAAGFTDDEIKGALTGGDGADKGDGRDTARP